MGQVILVVDDDPGISEMVAIILESEGYRPFTVTNASTLSC